MNCDGVALGIPPAYSNIIGFGSDEITDTSTPAVNGTGSDATEPTVGEVQEDEHKCKICHKCSEPLGLCIWIWIVIIVVVVLVIAAVVFFILKKKKDAHKKTPENKEE